MSSTPRLVVVTVLLLVPVTRPAVAQTKTFSATAGSWLTNSNWTPSGVPGPSNNVLINSGSTTMTLTASNMTIQYITFTYTGSRILENSTGSGTASNLTLATPDGAGNLVTVNPTGTGRTFTIRNGPTANLNLILGASGGFSVNSGNTLTVTSTVSETGGSRSLTKAGAGTLNLGAANTYTGTTAITGGILTLQAGGSINNSSGVVVGTGATFNVSAVTGGYKLGQSTAQTLSGTGTVTGPVTVQSGSTVQAGAGAVGDTLTVNGGLTFQTNSTLRATVGNGGAVSDLTLTGASLLSAGGALGRSSAGDTLAITLDADANFLNNAVAFTQYTRQVATYGSLSNLPTGTYTPATSDFTLTATNFAIDPTNWQVIVGGGTVQVAFTPVPEPAVTLALAAGGVGLLRLRRRND